MMKTPVVEKQLAAADAKAFVLAGKAVFTIRSLKTGKRYTYRVRKAPEKQGWAPAWFVSFLTGPDNAASYSYLGMIRNGEFKLTAKSKMTEASEPVLAFWWLWKVLAAGTLSGIEFWHAGRCGRCGHVLTVPESIECGIGPECKQLMAA